MVMEPFSSATQGTQSTQYYDRTGKPLGDPILSRQTASEVSLLNITSQGKPYGGFKSHSYDLHRKAVTKGTVYGPKWSGTSNTQSIAEGQVLGTGAGGVDLNPTAPLLTSARARALSKYYDRCRGELDLSINLFEVQQTSRMINNLMKARTQFLAHLPEIMKRSKIKTLSNAWLQFQYGWRPIVNDIFTTTEMLLDRGVGGFVRRVTAKSAQEDKTFFRAGSSPIVNMSSERYTIGAKCSIIGEFVTPPMGYNAASFTSLNPVSIAWEILPYSFVVDWLLDVGGYLRNVESAALQRPSFRGGCITLIRYARTDGPTAFRANKAGYTGAAGEWTEEYVRYARSRLSAPPTAEVPRFKLQMGLARWTSAVALLAQAIGRYR